MANEIQVAHESGGVVYAIVRNALGDVWRTDTAAFGIWDNAQIGSYDIALTEQGASGFFVGSFPAAITAPGRYSVEARRQAGGAPALSDTVVGTGALDWDGAAEIGLATVAQGVTALPGTGEIVAAVFTRVIETGVTFEQALRGMVADAVGDIEVDTATGATLIKSVDDTKERARAIMGSDGTRTITARDLS